MSVNNNFGRITFFDIFYLGFILLCGQCAIWILHPKSLLVSIFVFLFGCLLPVVAYYLMFFFGKTESLPICRKKQCKAIDYIIERHAEEGDYYRCGCGDLYILTTNEEFKIAEIDGTATPYKRRYYTNGPWRPDVGNQ